MKACEVCGAPLKEDGNVCTSCGELVAGEKETAEEETVSTIAESEAETETDEVVEETETKEVVAEGKAEATNAVAEVEAEKAEDDNSAESEAKDESVVEETSEEIDAVKDVKVAESDAKDESVVEEISEEIDSVKDGDSTVEELEKKGVEWVAPPDPYEDKQKRIKIAKIVGAVVVAITVIALGLFMWQKLSGTTEKAKKEVPLVYIAGDGALKIHQRGMAESATLGNQGYTNDVFFAPILLSDDNSMIAYITEAKGLFYLPATSATSGVVDAKYFVEDAVEEILAFAPDNNNLYYLGANNVLKMFDGKKSIVISENIYMPAADSQNLAASSVISVLNNNRILYYTGVEMAKVLHTQISTDQKSLKEIGSAETVLFLSPEDQGVFFYELIMGGESYSYFSKYYEFKSEAIFEYGDATNLADILYLGVDGAMITMEAIQTPALGDVLEQASTENIVIEEPVDEDDSALTEEDELITEFSVDDATNGAEAEEPVQHFGVFYLKNGERKEIVDDVVSFQYVALDGSFLVFTNEEGGNKNCWFVAVDKNGDTSEKHLFATIKGDQNVYVTGMPDDKGIIASLPGAEANMFAATKFLRKGNKLGEGILVDDLAELVLHNTVAGKLIIEKNVNLLTGPEIEGTSAGSLYLADLYAADEKGQELLGSGVDLYSPGTANGSVQHDDKILFLKDCYFNEQGYAYGTLTMYKKGVTTEIVKDFLLPSTQEGMAVVYVADDLIYGFNYNLDAQTVEMILYSGEGQPKVLDGDVMTLVTGY